MSGRVNVGVVGAGKMGTLHIEKCLQESQAKLIGFYDHNAQRSRIVQQRFGVPCFSSLEELLYEVDAVVIATPTGSHFSIAKQALRGGVHVLVEKPLTYRTDQAHELVHLAERNQLILQVGFLERFRFGRLLEKLPPQEFSWVHFYRRNTTLGRDPSADVIYDLLVHDIDLVLSLNSGRPRVVEAVGTSMVTDRIDLVQVRLEFPNAMVGILEASRVDPIPVRGFVAYSRELQVNGNFLTNELSVKRMQDGGVQTHSIGLDPLEKQCQQFFECIRSQHTPWVSGKQAVLSLELVEEITTLLSTRRGSEKHLAPQEHTPKLSR